MNAGACSYSHKFRILGERRVIVIRSYLYFTSPNFLKATTVTIEISEIMYAYPTDAAPTSPPTLSPEVQQWFNNVDKDQTGRIDAIELRAALANGQGEHFSDVACQLMIGMFDKDKNGTIDVYEFQQLFDYINQWLSVFRLYDRDNSGVIDESELNSALNQMGFKLSPDFIKMLIAKSDLKSHEKMSIDKFIVTCVQIQRFTEAFRRRDNQLQGVISIAFEDFLTVALECSI